MFEEKSEAEQKALAAELDKRRAVAELQAYKEALRVLFGPQRETIAMIDRVADGLFAAAGY